MKQIDLRRVDLNLLVVLDVLLRERGVTAAARVLSRTQSAISHALARLRETLQDPLLVRVGGQMRPTAFAQALAPELERALAGMARVLSPAPAFEPARSTRHFRIAGPDFALAVFPALHEAVSAQAPRVQLEWLAPRPHMLRDLADGQLDLALWSDVKALPEGLACQSLGEIGWAVFARRDHPAAKDWNARRWSEGAHVVVRIGDDEGPVAHALQSGKRAGTPARHVAAYVPNFSAVAPLLAESDLLATLPLVTMAQAARRFGLAALAPPLPMPPMGHSLFWSLRDAGDPAVNWLRGIVLEAFDRAMQAARALPVKAIGAGEGNRTLV